MSELSPINQEDMDIWRPSAAINPERLNYLWTLAERMADSSLVPESLRTEGKGTDKVDLPREKVVANVFAVVEQADRWNISPFALLACAAIVHGRLGFEGKVISSVLKSSFGIDLDYEWNGTGENMSITIRGKKPGSDKVLEVTGTVAEWKTTGNGSPWRPTTYAKMLAYRGAREFARVHEPSAILGVLADDEIQQIGFERNAQIARTVVPTLQGRFGGVRNSEGFDAAAVTKQIEHAQTVAMEKIDTETGEIIETSPSSSKVEPAPHKGSGAGSSPAADTTNSPDTSRSSSPAAGDSAAGDNEGPSSQPTLPRSVFTKFATTIARFKTEQNVKKGVKAFFETEGIKAGTQVERDLFATIRDQYIASVVNGGMDVGKFLAEANSWIEQDVPEEVL